jgi:cysteine protease ATG4
MSSPQKSSNSVLMVLDDEELFGTANGADDNWYHLGSNLRVSLSSKSGGGGAVATKLASSTDDNNSNEEEWVESAGWRDALLNRGQSKLSALYNLLRSEPHQVTLSAGHDIWMLGQVYSLAHRTVPQQQRLLEAFAHDLASRFYFSYRRDFAPLRPSGLQTDTGWGCVHRAGQMMLAEAFSRHFLGRGWRVGGHEQRKHALERQIVSWFDDKPSAHIPYSLHNICQVGAMFDTPPGVWFSPSLIAHVLAFLVQSHRPGDLMAVVMRDATVVKGQVLDACRYDASEERIQRELLFAIDSFRSSNGAPSSAELAASSSPPAAAAAAAAAHAGPLDLPRVQVHDGGPLAELCESYRGESAETPGNARAFRPLLLFVPMRLGVDELNQEYARQLVALLRMEQTIGIVAGEPSRAYFVVASQADAVFVLDPHVVQPYEPLTESASLDRFHCRLPRTVAIDALAPTMLAGFYCADERDFRHLCERLEVLAQVSEPIISVVDSVSVLDGQRNSIVQSLRPDTDPLLMSLAI